MPLRSLGALQLFISLGLAVVIGIHAPPTRAQDRPASALASPTTEVLAQWEFEETSSDGVSAGEVNLAEVGRVGVIHSAPGPRSPDYPDFAADNRAAVFDGRSYIRYADPGEDSPFDFGLGDALTIEAWVRPGEIPENQQVYLVGKGRTGRRGADIEPDNQNWALRLRGSGSLAKVSFLFRGTDSDDQPASYHRWNTDLGVLPDGRWHHVALKFEFGNPDSIAAFIDGQQASGSWDMGQNHAVAPVQDDDEIWLGSAIMGQAASTYRGELDQVVIHRGLVSDGELGGRYQTTLTPSVLKPLADAAIDDSVVVEILEGLGSDKSWELGTPWLTERFEISTLALTDLPVKYNERGVRIDRTNPFLVRLRGRVQVSSGGLGLLRSKNAARLWIDGTLLAETEFMSRNASGHEPVPDLAPPQIPGMHPLPSGHQEVTFEVPAGTHLIQLETVVGGNGLRPELGDLCFAIRQEPAPFVVCGPRDADQFELSSANWLAFERDNLAFYRDLNQQRRRDLDLVESRYWEHRHELARSVVASLPPLAPPRTAPAQHPVDAWIESTLQTKGLEPTPLVDDLGFLRRLYLDTVGVPPSVAELEAFLSDDANDRRDRWIERVLQDPRWADHWVGYWQDVLAENPGILKPELNNTGPFRYWIYESFLDNKPMDRFATELIRMEGSRLGGGPAGFAMASQNDVPMAAKSIVVTHAFLGMNMTCARCHDSPDREAVQEDLFSIAAMLERSPITLPATSSVPVRSDGTHPAVTVSLRPGQQIAPEWPFASASWSQHRQIAVEQLARNPGDPRERLAVLITTPENERFAQVLVNRLWARWLGRGIVEPVEDWEMGSPTHPELLRWLGRELVGHDYDLKHVARLILTSQTYQRQATDDPEAQRWLAGPARRRLTAEQAVDTLYAIAGKSMGSELLTLDPEGRRPASTFLNLGVPTRAWNYVSLSNERDRPALALPVAQGVVDLLIAFGWRDSRPNPQSNRDHSPQVLQPLIVANGDAAHRLTQFSEESWFTQWSLEAETPEAWTKGVFLRILGRYPTPAELADFVPLVADGFEDRVIPGASPQPVESQFRNAVSWSNHLHPDATSIKMQLEAEARRGDPPTRRLLAAWRERAEDIVWVAMNSPELLFIP